MHQWQQPMVCPCSQHAPCCTMHPSPGAGPWISATMGWVRGGCSTTLDARITCVMSPLCTCSTFRTLRITPSARRLTCTYLHLFPSCCAVMQTHLGELGVVAYASMLAWYIRCVPWLWNFK